MNTEIARMLAAQFGLTVSSDDAPKVIQMIQNAYDVGCRDEREACAILVDSEASNVAERLFAEELAAAIRARGTP